MIGLLRLPGIAPQAAFGFLSQLTQQVAPVGMVLVVQQATGSLVLAGLSAAACSLGTGLARPVQGRVMDSRGPRGVLVATAIVHVGALVGLLLAAEGWLMVVLALVAGAGLPPVSVAMRLVWGRRVPDDARTAAYSLVYLVQELAILIGPLVFGLMIALASASPALGLVAALAGAGTLAFAASMPPGVRRSDQVRGRVFAHRGMLVLLAVVFLLGGTIGALEVGLPALASAQGAPAATGLLVAALSLGGIAGAAGYGARPWPGSPGTRLVVLMLAMAVALGPLVLIDSLPVFAAVLFVAGIALNPVLTTSSLLVDELAPSAQAEAFGWISTAAGAGAAAGSGIAGVVAEHVGRGLPFLAAALFAGLGSCLASTLRRS